MNLLLGIPIILLCILLEGFFAGSEIGFISCNRIRISDLADKGDKKAKIVISFLESPERFLSTTLVGVNLSVVVSSSVMTAIMSKYIKTPGEDALIATAILLPLVLVFGELLPKIIYRQHPDTLAIFSAYPLRAASAVLSPLIYIATKVSALITRVFTGKVFAKNPYVTREEIRLLMLDAAKKGVLDKDEINMTNEIFDFGRTSVRSVMVPLNKVISASDSSSTKDVLELVSKSGFSRVPIYSGKENNIVGTIEISDLVSEDVEKKDLKDLILPPYQVDEDKNLEEILKDFQSNQENVAIVVDKTGKAIGIATIEDIVEEIFGEIEDEYDVSR